ncbi:MAG: stage V sporulation protein AD [Clostridium sp.]|nr:stage V sporulation protein AD [Clostridium sp.]MCM1399272.1 stage V sporulation protein AD [Clostridium sp.]MCM1459760.1 stage V sporulation protein AD [Bacteroides sp.]
MKNQSAGKQSIVFDNPPVIISQASIVGEMEGQGPLGSFFDQIETDPTFGQDSWELGESEMVRRAVNTAITKSGIDQDKIKYIFGGDLLGQLIGTTFGLKDFNIPLFGLYGACSTSGEALSLAAMTVAAGYAENAIAVTSSHYGGAEKQFRFPLEYGNQRPLSATWTVTGSGAFIVSQTSKETPMLQYPRITAITTGKIVDYGVRDSLNMGACMAPAAADSIYQCLEDLNVKATSFDKIITGDLGKVGSEILIKLLNDNGHDISKLHMDCGVNIYSNERQDTHSGGSGCGCAAVTLAGYILHNLKQHTWKRILFVPTGALLSTVSYNEGQTIPGIAHALVIEQQ